MSEDTRSDNYRRFIFRSERESWSVQLHAETQCCEKCGERRTRYYSWGPYTALCGLCLDESVGRTEQITPE